MGRGFGRYTDRGSPFSVHGWSGFGRAQIAGLSRDDVDVLGATPSTAGTTSPSPRSTVPTTSFPGQGRPSCPDRRVLARPCRLASGGMRRAYPFTAAGRRARRRGPSCLRAPRRTRVPGRRAPRRGHGLGIGGHGPGRRGRQRLAAKGDPGPFLDGTRPLKTTEYQTAQLVGWEWKTHFAVSSEVWSGEGDATNQMRDRWLIRDMSMLGPLMSSASSRGAQ